MTYLAGSLTSVSAVKRITRLTNELTDDEIGSFIYDVTRELYQEHGYPIKTAHCIIDEADKTYYIMPSMRNGESVYSVDRVIIEGSLVAEGSYTASASAASVTLGSSLEVTYANKYLYIGFTPYIYHQLATFMVAFDIIQAHFIVAGQGGEFPRTAWIKQRIDSIKEKLAQDGLLMSSGFATYDHYGGDYVYQDDINSI